VKRELRGFLLGLLVAFLWVVLTAGIGGSEGKYQMVMGGSGGTTPVVLDTETGQVYAVRSGSEWLDLSSPSTARIVK